MSSTDVAGVSLESNHSKTSPRTVIICPVPTFIKHMKLNTHSKIKFYVPLVYFLRIHVLKVALE